MNDAEEGAGGEEEADALREIEGPQELGDAHSEAAYRVPESRPEVPRGSAPAVREEDAVGERQGLPAPDREHDAHKHSQAHRRAPEKPQEEACDRESVSTSGSAPAKSCSAPHRLAGAASWRDPDGDMVAVREGAKSSAQGGALLPPQRPPRTPAAMRSWLTIMRSQVEDDGAAQRKQEHAGHEMHIIDDHGIMHVLRVGPAPRSGDADGYRSVCHETYAASSSADSNGLSMTMVSDAGGGKTSRNDMHTEIYTNWRDRRSGGSSSSGTLMGGERLSHPPLSLFSQPPLSLFLARSSVWALAHRAHLHDVKGNRLSD